MATCHSFGLLCFLYMVQAGIDVIHYCCMDVVGWKRSRVEAGLQVEGGFMWVLRSKSVEELPSVPNGTRTYALHIRGSNGPVSECLPA